MKKVKLSNIVQDNNANNLTNVLGFTTSGLVKTRGPIADLRVSDVLVDANKLHEIYGPLLVIKISAAGSLNIPNVSGHGIIIHVQRQERGLVTVSQIIGQFFFHFGGVYSRSGQGNGTSIIFTEWKLL